MRERTGNLNLIEFSLIGDWLHVTLISGLPLFSLNACIGLTRMR